MRSSASKSAWKSIGDADFMIRDGRAIHPSRRAVLKRLTRLSSSRAIRLLSTVTYRELLRADLPIEYTGIDINETVIESARRGFPEADWQVMGIDDLSFSAGSFDVTHCRHVLEHLPHYETAVRELFRVTSELVVICFWIPPAEDEQLHRSVRDGTYMWLNRYARRPLEDLLAKLSSSVEVEDVPFGDRLDRIYFCKVGDQTVEESSDMATVRSSRV